jgi:hypothetical protein
MSSNHLVREPAWAGLEPSLPEWSPADAGDVASLCQQPGLSGQLLAAQFQGRPVPDMFRLERHAALPLLLKLIDHTRRDASERAERIARWLVECGVRVAAPLAGYPRTLADGRLLIAMPFLDGRRVRTTASDLHGLGAALGQLHQALARHPDRDMWKDATARRLSELASVRAEVAAGWAYGPDAEALSALAADRDLDFAATALAARPLHGDFNPGNVLVVDGSVTVLDFEDVFHSVLPPIFELALAVERFILIRCADDDEATRMGRAFLAGYTSLPGAAPAFAGCDPVPILRSLALRSLVTLASGARSGVIVSDAEWHKFLDLERQAAARATVIRSIFGGFGV